MDAAARAFYAAHPIVAEGNVVVQDISDERGKGVVTTVAAKEGDLLFTEFPVLSMQHTDNRRFLLACDFCLRSIGTVREQWLRMLNARRSDRATRRQHRHERKQQDDGDEDDDEDDDEDEDEAAIEEKDDLLPYDLPDPLPFTTPSLTQPSFDISRYDVTPIPCAHGCDELYCSAECRDKAWQQYHALLCPRRSFKAQQQDKKKVDGEEVKGSKTATKQSPPQQQQHPLQALYSFADDSNEIFRIVVKLIATVISTSTSAASPAPSTSSASSAFPPSASSSSSSSSSPLFPFSLFASSLWWEQVWPPSDLSPASALRFRDTLKSLCEQCAKLIAPLFPEHSAPSHPLHQHLFTPTAVGRLVSIFETNQLSLFAPSPLPTYLAFYHALPAALQESFRAALPAPVFAHTAALQSLRVEGFGLFTVACCINHSCRPTCLLLKRDHEREEEGFVDLDATMAIMCVRPVGVGEEITLSYVEEPEGAELSWRERANVLRDYGIACKCERCEEEKEAEEAGAASDDSAELSQYEDDDNEQDDDAEQDEDDDQDDEAE